MAQSQTFEGQTSQSISRPATSAAAQSAGSASVSIATGLVNVVAGASKEEILNEVETAQANQRRQLSDELSEQ